MYMHYMDLHAPYESGGPAKVFSSGKVRLLSDDEATKITLGAPGNERNLYYHIDRYDDQIRQLDGEIGRFLQSAASEGVLANSIVVITADHGEAFFEHGVGNHGFTLYGEEIDVPLIVRLPDSLRTRGDDREDTALIDLMPTVLTMAGINQPSASDGRVIAGLPRPGGSNGRALYSEIAEDHNGRPACSVIKGSWKGIYRPDEHRLTELYDLESDASERVNVIATNAQKARELAADIERWRREMAEERAGRFGAVPGHQVAVDDRDMREGLRALGYVQ
jgi:arylsulfatase